MTLFALDPRLAPGGLADLRNAVASLHAAGMQVVLDIVLNHSGESDEAGATLSFRGLDNATYYRLDPSNPVRYINDTGCGNTLAFDRPPVIRMVLDALRMLVLECGVDGFRFDLATTMARRADGFDPHAPLLAALQSDPVLKTVC